MVQFSNCEDFPECFVLSIFEWLLIRLYFSFNYGLAFRIYLLSMLLYPLNVFAIWTSNLIPCHTQLSSEHLHPPPYFVNVSQKGSQEAEHMQSVVAQLVEQGSYRQV